MVVASKGRMQAGGFNPGLRTGQNNNGLWAEHNQKNYKRISCTTHNACQSSSVPVLPSVTKSVGKGEMAQSVCRAKGVCVKCHRSYEKRQQNQMSQCCAHRGRNATKNQTPC